MSRKSAADVDPKTALVLWWHWSRTPSPDVPTWARAHPLWPRNYDPAEFTIGHLTRPARTLIEQFEKEIDRG
jgi:hypothetical protein